MLLRLERSVGHRCDVMDDGGWNWSNKQTKKISTKKLIRRFPLSTRKSSFHPQSLCYKPYLLTLCGCCSYTAQTLASGRMCRAIKWEIESFCETAGSKPVRFCPKTRVLSQSSSHLRCEWYDITMKCKSCDLERHVYCCCQPESVFKNLV
jgi:hypothetical protein